MKAAVLQQYNQPLVIEDLVIDKPGPNEVLVRTVASGLCQSELHWFSGEVQAELPFVAGHEAAGIVEQVGANVTRVKPGDAVGRGGTAVIVGVMPHDARISLGYGDLMDGKRIQACLMGDNRFPIDVPRLVDFYMRDMLHLDTLLAETIALEQINEGYEKLKTGNTARSVIVFD